MESSVDQQSITNEYESKRTEIEDILSCLRNLVVESKCSLEGNSFYTHATLDLYPCLYSKQLNLFWSGKQAEKRICEIGFNAGHSTMLLLLGNLYEDLNFTVFDIGHHKYTRPCLEYIKTRFSKVNFEYVEGDSTLTMPKWIESNRPLCGMYDVVHVDGGHSDHCIINDMKNSDVLVKINGIIIVDDSHCDNINRVINAYIHSGKYIEVGILKTEGYKHRIIRKIRI